MDAVDDTDVDSQCDDNPIDDLEEEPSLGWTDAQARSDRHSDFAGNDCELDTCDDEPSLGSLERPVSCYGPDGPNPTGDQTNWTWGGTDDREDEHDGREPSEDDEPSLGSTSTTINQEAWSFGSNADREQGTTRCFREGPKKIEKVD